MMKISIIVPVYNVEEYLSECLESILNQTLQDIEILCINDGSIDSSLSILEMYAQKDARVKIFSKPNSGYGHTMNIGLDNASGEYIGIVESDDYVPPEMYEELYKQAKQNDLDFIKADFYRFTTENGKLDLEYNALANGKDEYYNKVLDPAENIEIFKFIMNTWSGIYKRDFIEEYHIRHNETPGASFQDNGFFFQTFCQASRIMFVNKPYYMNRRDNPNSSVKSGDKVFCMRDEHEFIRNFLEEKPILKEKYIHVYWHRKFHNYMFTYNRVASEFKKLFILHFCEEFTKALKENELRKDLFTDSDWDIINQIINDPIGFSSRRESIKETRLQKIRHYTKVFFIALKKDGLKYTLNLLHERIKNK